MSNLPELKKQFGKDLIFCGARFTGDLRLDSASKVLYSTDASIYQIEPLGVAIPKTQEDLHAAVELAAKYNIPILRADRGLRWRGKPSAKR
jgi:FAD/FMN-containing dehydrogenase